MCIIWYQHILKHVLGPTSKPTKKLKTCQVQNDVLQRFSGFTKINYFCAIVSNCVIEKKYFLKKNLVSIIQKIQDDKTWSKSAKDISSSLRRHLLCVECWKYVSIIFNTIFKIILLQKQCLRKWHRIKVNHFLY